jgi:PBSX family phage terminase large subunit
MNKPAPFTQNQADYFNRCFDSWFNVAEGGKRGGKNVLQTMAFCAMLENHPNKLHLIAGVSQTTAKLNILDCDGYGLLNYFEGECREGKYKDRSCLYVNTKSGEKVVLISGGAKDGDEKYIKGNTYGMAYVTEANECHPKFIKEVFDRTLSSFDRKVMHDLNPKAPGHWYYTDILKPHEEKQIRNDKYGYNYGHFTIADNLSISDEMLKKRLATYEKGTVWYNRDILGKRQIAEGLVYNFTDANITDEIPQKGSYHISIDYGTKNPCSMGLWCVVKGLATRIKEYYWNGRNGEQKTDEEYYRELVMLAGEYPIEWVVVDPSAASFITTIKKHGEFRVVHAKNDVINGIRYTADLLKNGRIKIHKDCKSAIEEFGLYSWDEKSTEDKPIKENDHAMDDIRYFAYTIMRKLYFNE